MIVGIVKEMKLNEYRVALTPDGVYALVALNTKVIVEKGAGEGAGFSDQDYINSGASIVEESSTIYKECDLILHVRRPHTEEYNFMKEGQVLLSFLFSINHEEQTKALLDLKTTCIAYETIELENGTLPILAAMSEIAGKMAPLQAAKFLETPYGGNGTFIGRIAGVEPTKVVIIGNGVVGANAAHTAARLGADVYLLGIHPHLLRELDKELPDNVKTIVATPWSVKQYLADADVVIGAVHTSGLRTPKILTRDDLKLMKKGTVLIDIAIEQGGCFETSKPTTHQEPIFVLDGIIHYCVPNMPSYFPKTSSIALTHSTLPYIIDLVTKGSEKALKENHALAKGVHLYKGHIVDHKIADIFGMEYTNIEELL